MNLDSFRLWAGCLLLSCPLFSFVLLFPMQCSVNAHPSPYRGGRWCEQLNNLQAECSGEQLLRTNTGKGYRASVFTLRWGEQLGEQG